MNAERRKMLRAALDRADIVRSDLIAVRDEEQEAYDNLPESLQSGERAEAMLELIEQLDEAVNALDALAEVTP